MNTTPTNTATSDELDKLLSDFFKDQLKKPWPNAPVPVAAATEPSELATARAAEAPRNAPAPSHRDSIARARFTLAASVALLLGTCWYMSNGFAPGERPGRGTETPVTPKLLPDGGADGILDPRLQKIGEDKAKGNSGNAGGTKMDMGKFE